MALDGYYLSRPGVAFPATRVENDEILRRVQQHFRGNKDAWNRLRSSIERVFTLCNTRVRFLDADPSARVADYAVQAAQACLKENDVSIESIDLIVHGGIPRQYFEPATAMEIADKLGFKQGHAFDVTAACVGHLEALHAAAAQLSLHPEYRAALITTAELTYDSLDYDIQTPVALRTKAAGLTIGNAAGAWILRRTPWPRGGLRLLGIETHTEPQYWRLCSAPVDGKFESATVELMRLSDRIPDFVRKNLGRLGLSVADVNHFIFHQPSDAVLRRALEELGVSQERGVFTHQLYGNTASASVCVTYHHLLRTSALHNGDIVVLGSAAAGFTTALATGIWSAS